MFKSRTLLYHVLLNINKRHTQSCTCHRQYITVFTPISNYIETDETSMIIVLALRPEVLLFCWSVLSFTNLSRWNVELLTYLNPTPSLYIELTRLTLMCTQPDMIVKLSKYFPSKNPIKPFVFWDW